MAHADSVMNLKLDLGDTYLVAIDLETAVKKPGSLQDVIMRDGDELVIPQFSNTVKISGEVMSPITINYDSGKGLKYYLKRAGGCSNRAQRSKTYVVYMNGAVKELGRRCWAKDIAPGCEIVVPASSYKRGLSTAEIMTIGTSTASVATMIVTMVNVLLK
jgi:protein involved in polysaccharide export with SLBB domain